jgi:hypothetical protein
MPSWSEQRTSPWCRPAFGWNDLGSWQSLLDVGPSDKQGNVIVGDVVAIGCENSYIRSDGRLLSAIGLKDVAIVSTADATFVAPVSHSQHVKKIVEQLEKSGRLETRFTRHRLGPHREAAWKRRVHHWLFQRLLLWSTVGVDERHGGFHEALGFDTTPLINSACAPWRGRSAFSRQGARLGRPGRSSDQPRHRVHDQERPYRQWRLGAHAECRRLGRRRCRGCLRSFLRTLALAHALSGNPMPCGWAKTFAFLDAHLEDSRMPASSKRRTVKASGAPTRTCICWKPSSPGTRRRATVLSTGRRASSTCSAPFLRPGKLDAGRIFRC